MNTIANIVATTTNTSIVAATTDNNAKVNAAVTTENPKQSQQKQTAQQLVRENVQYLIEQLEAGHSDALTGFLRAMAVFRTYSLSNQLAIARQRPTASRVAGMYAWNQLGRYVNKGEKGIAILAPVIASIEVPPPQLEIKSGSWIRTQHVKAMEPAIIPASQEPLRNIKLLYCIIRSAFGARSTLCCFE